MFSKQNILFILLAASAIVVCVVAQQHRVDVNVLELLARSTNLMALNPKGSTNCFTYYVNDIGKITTKYETDYDNCCNIAKNQRIEVELHTADSHTSFGNRTDETCAALTRCKEETSVDNKYDCYIYEGNVKANNLHDMSNEAFIELAKFVEQIRIIEKDESMCTNKTRKTYEDESRDAYVNFDNCLKGRKEAPTPKPTPEPTPTSTTAQTTTEREEITTTPEDEDNF